MIEHLVLLAIFGLMVGSFLNVCIGRLPAGESIVSPGSRCPVCRTPIKWYDNIPVVGYLVLGGRCRACRASISARYPIVEIATSLAFVGQGVACGEDWPLLAGRLIFTAMLIVLFGIDLDVQRLPNVITLPGIAVGLGFSLFAAPGPLDSLLGAALGAALLGIVRWAWFRATGVEGMGLGDVKMLAMVGAFVGWQQVWVTLFLASVVGALVGVALIGVARMGVGHTAARGRTLQTKLPFGTFLAVAAYVASVAGEPLVAWYVSLYQ